MKYYYDIIDLENAGVTVKCDGQVVTFELNCRIDNEGMEKIHTVCEYFDLGDFAREGIFEAFQKATLVTVLNNSLSPDS